MKKIIVFAFAITLFAFIPKKKLTGRWESKPSAKGNITGVVFNEDQTYEGYINRKPFVSGRYTLKRNKMTIEETGCNGHKSIYRIILFSGADSMRFEPISDSCKERREGMAKTILGRIK